MPNDRRLGTQRIEISNVSFWAFSQEADNSVCLWASGKAGWFELHDPVPQYRDFFEGMNEAVSMLYYLADKWRRSRKSHLCVKDKELEKYVRCVFRDDIYEETESRLYPPRHPRLGKTKLPSKEHQRKTLPSRTVIAQKNGHTRSHRTRLSARDEVPHTPLQPNGRMNDTDTSGDEEHDGNGNLIRAGTKRKSKSILRPKGSKFSKKNAGRRPSLPTLVGDIERLNSISDSEDEVSEASPLAAVATRESPPGFPREALRESSYPCYEPRKFKEVKMVSYDVPSDQPQGPGDLWTCAFENCNRRVHEASKPKGKAQIREHFQDHARQAQEKIDLALSEARPYLPVR
ncbi:MAG: hypothetical protein LQ344_007665 [Seirophora lacunosa]|nr:MAG: hypothetical protein LQ344_007665 [Seirophora lacunosa]